MAEHVRGQNRNSPKGSSTQPIQGARTNNSSGLSSLKNNKKNDRTVGDGRDSSRAGFHPGRNFRIDDYDGQLSDE